MQARGSCDALGRLLDPFFCPIPNIWMPRASFYTLGCKLNYAETSTIARQFETAGFEVVTFGAPADVTVINTCSVTQEADRKCRQTIRRAQRANPDAFIVVTGCYAQLEPDQLANIDGVDAVLGTAEKFSILELVRGFQKREHTQVEVSCIDTTSDFRPAFSGSDRTRAFLKVQDGCDYVCSFCTIPRARGRSRSQTIQNCVSQARALAERGFTEVVLSGVNIGLFGTENGERLLDLLRALDAVEGVQRYRISSIEPNLLTDAIIDFVAGSSRFQPHFHLPLQSGDDYVLGKMRRRYRRARYQNRVERIRHALPHACIGADVIVGFPAENARRFDNTCAFLADLPVSYLHVFTYSEREKAPLMRTGRQTAEDGVPHPERSRRNRVLRGLSGRKLRAFYKEHSGSVRPVLWEGADDGVQYGFTDNYIRVQRSAEPAERGRTELVRLGPFVAPDALAAEPAVEAELPVL